MAHTVGASPAALFSWLWLVFVSLDLHSRSVCVTAKIAIPFKYKGYESFPASFFGADIWGVENTSEMALVAKVGCMRMSCCSSVYGMWHVACGV